MESQGLRMEFRPLKPKYVSGDTPDFEVLLTNVNNQDVVMCTYLLEYRLMSTMQAGDFFLILFDRPKIMPLSEKDFRIIKSKETFTVPILLSKKTGWKFIDMTAAPPVLFPHVGFTTFPRGTFIFELRLWNRVPVYGGEPDAFDFNAVEAKDLFTEIPQEAGRLPLDKAWKGEMTAEVSVDFA